MGQTIKFVYENGVCRPLEPVTLIEGARLEVELHGLSDAVSAEEYERTLKDLQDAVAEEFTDSEWAEVEKDILGPERLAARLGDREKV